MTPEHLERSTLPQRNREDVVGFYSESGNATMFRDMYSAQPEFRERLQIWNELLERYATAGEAALDMGCGPGVFTFRLSKLGAAVIGIDGSEAMVNECESRRAELGADNVRFLHARLPLERESDLEPVRTLISSSVVEYIDDLDAVLAQFARLLKPGGTLIVSMPNVLSVSRTYQRLKFKITGRPEFYQFIRHFSSPFLLRRRVSRYGLVFVEARYYDHVTRVAKLGRALGLPPALTDHLFVAVFRKQ